MNIKKVNKNLDRDLFISICSWTIFDKQKVLFLKIHDFELSSKITTLVFSRKVKHLNTGNKLYWTRCLVHYIFLENMSCSIVIFPIVSRY